MDAVGIGTLLLAFSTFVVVLQTTIYRRRDIKNAKLVEVKRVVQELSGLCVNLADVYMNSAISIKNILEASKNLYAFQNDNTPTAKIKYGLLKNKLDEANRSYAEVSNRLKEIQSNSISLPSLEASMEVLTISINDEELTSLSKKYRLESTENVVYDVKSENESIPDGLVQLVDKNLKTRENLARQVNTLRLIIARLVLLQR